MKAARTIRTRRAEAGIALLISIFILLLISVVAIALIVSSSTESSLAGNYRSSTDVYYAALAGIEEARGRLLTKDPYSFKSTWATFYPALGTPLPIGTVGYVLNPGPTETAGTLLATYPDSEYDAEFGPGALATATGAGNVKTTLSVWNKAPLTSNLSFPGPLYKWVRINAVSEQSLKLDAYPYDTSIDPKLIYYDGTYLNDTNSGSQVFEITALAVLPNGSGQSSQKLVQYLSAPVPLDLSFSAALTMDGHDVLFSVPTSNNFFISGNDNDNVGSCNPVAAPVTTVGYIFDPADTSRAHILAAIPTGPPAGSDRRNNYQSGALIAPNSVARISVSPNLQTVGGLNSLVQSITQVADAVITPVPDATGLGTATQADLPAAMTSSNPMTVVVNGNLDVNAWHGTGYGLLVVTGEFKYDPDASWKGIVLVIGVGKFSSSKSGTGDFHGAMFLAKTVNTATSPYTPLSPSSPPGIPNFAFTTGSGGDGIYYSNCWIQASMPTANYKVLSFHEISQ